MSGARCVMDAADVRRAVRRIALELVERTRGGQGVALVGIRTRGEPLAHRIAAELREVEGLEVPVGALDIAMYRDDVFESGSRVAVGQTHLPFDVNDRHIVLVDDVLFTGRTVRAALDALMDWGRPCRIQLAVLVDRGHRELPIQPDYVGMTLSTRVDESVRVRLAETDTGESDRDTVHLVSTPERVAAAARRRT